MVSLPDQSRTSLKSPTVFASTEGIVGRCRVIDKRQLGGARVRFREQLMFLNSAEGSVLNSVRVRFINGFVTIGLQNSWSNWLLELLGVLVANFANFLPVNEVLPRHIVLLTSSTSMSPSPCAFASRVCFQRSVDILRIVAANSLQPSTSGSPSRNLFVVDVDSEIANGVPDNKTRQRLHGKQSHTNRVGQLQKKMPIGFWR